MRLSILIPARNEAGNIATTIGALQLRLAREAIDYEIVVVDDGSSDDTSRVVERLGGADARVRLVVNRRLHGYGYAVRCGLKAYTGDAVVIVMADGSDDPEHVIAYYYILRDKAECAFGSRWMRGGQVYDYPLVKRVLNRAANTFLRLLFDRRYDDYTNAFKGYRRDVIEGCRPFLSPHFNLTVEIPLKAIVRGYTYAVVPISWRNRKLGRSSLKIDEMGSRYFYSVMIVWLEKLLTMGDYRRPDNEGFRPFSEAPAETGQRSEAQESQVS